MRGVGVVEEGCQKGSEKWAEDMSVGGLLLQQRNCGFSNGTS